MILEEGRNGYIPKLIAAAKRDVLNGGWPGVV